ncbi:GNAT family N-acetyltransferase [Pseudomonas sp. gcc21]|uniref:GNAT family N-acetyltransferase n=1 Tax=Pseudomonas sp. gcc21 TaxID=2726989 RepID=UPI001451A30F|nr:GNAT family N-acetyltransferase [Pseudomonas sp. gcc21]QJD58320.1 GNAT family N-acetyltransferase [Pseudomonas sp. gcc21]
MMRNDVTIEVVDWLSCESLRDIRRAVFIDEQCIPADEEWDADDAISVHFLLCAKGEPAGTARLLPDGHIGRVAVMRDWRGTGLGKVLMLAVMDHARGVGMDILKLSAQTYALDFYRGLGFVVESGEYLEAGIPHHRMIWRSENDAADEMAPIEFTSPGRFAIHNPPEPARPVMEHPQPQRLGVEPELVAVDQQNALEHACNLALQARRSLTIYAIDQAMWLFNQRAFIESCKPLISSNPKARIRVLVQNVSKNLLGGHSIVGLMHRFPSYCEVRKQHPDLAPDPRVFLLADDAGILLLPRAVKRDGFARYNSRDQVKRHGDLFDEPWSSSQSDPALRRFLL